MRQLETDADLAEGAAHLARVCPVMARILPELGPLPLRRRAGGFPAIMNTVISQQISTAAANTIAGRLAAAGLDRPETILAAPDTDLRRTGLSRNKIRYLRAISAAQVDWDALPDLPDDEVIARLTSLPGIGRWSAEMYLMFALGRPDVFAPGDLALAEAARMALDLPDRPKPAELDSLAARWAPWRAVAARALWAYYSLEKGREGVR